MDAACNMSSGNEYSDAVQEKKKKLLNITREREQRAHRLNQRIKNAQTVFGCKFLGPTTCNSSFDFPRILNDVSDMLHEQESSKFEEEPEPEETPVVLSKSPTLESPLEVHTSLQDVEGPTLEIAPSVQKKVFYDRSAQTDTIEPQVVISPPSPSNSPEGVQTAEPLEEPAEAPIKELSESEVRSICSSDNFLRFLRRSSLVIERALAQQSDPTIDYGNEQHVGERLTDEGLTKKLVFELPPTTEFRPVTSVDWSPKYPELLLASYSEKPSGDDSPQGTVMVWSLNLPKRPEYTFECQSAVLCAKFDTESRHLVMGSCRSGEIVLWDMRSRQTTPVTRTSLAHGHTYPVYSIQSMPSIKRSCSFVSVSQDGQLCVWNDNILVEPTLSVRLSSSGEDVSPHCFGFAPRDPNSLYLGSESGRLYHAKLHAYVAIIFIAYHITTSFEFSDSGIQSCIRAHAGPITSISFQRVSMGMGKGSGNGASTTKEVSSLFLTSSFDWTVKLWSTESQAPIMTFESCNDYVHAVQWSPINVSLFCVCCGDGHIELWNLSRDLEMPVLRIRVSTARALSTVQFSDDGHTVAVADTHGRIHIYTIPSHIAESRPEDAVKMHCLVRDHLGRE